MNDLKLEYAERFDQFDKLLQFIEIIEAESKIFKADKKTIISTDNIVLNSLKSSLILMLYNIIEYAVIQSISLIEKDFESHDFKKFSTEFQSIFLKAFGINLNRLNFNTILSKIKDESLVNGMLNNIINNGYLCTDLDLNKKCKIKLTDNDGNSLGINGNINYKIIKRLSDFFNFKKVYTSQINGTNDLLSEIRDKRNNLAHGNISFNQIGKDLTIAQLKEYKNSTKNFLDLYITAVDTYLKNKPYLTK